MQAMMGGGGGGDPMERLAAMRAMLGQGGDSSLEVMAQLGMGQADIQGMAEMQALQAMMGGGNMRGDPSSNMIKQVPA